MDAIIKGGRYRVEHDCWGVFGIRVTNTCGVAVAGVITWGVARFLVKPNRYEGDYISINIRRPVVKFFRED